MKATGMNRQLKRVLRAGMVWDLTGGFVFLVVHGILQIQPKPPIYPFYAIIIGLFLVMLAYLQLISSVDVKRYALLVGVVISLRVLYASGVILFSLMVESLPSQFFLTAMVDTIFVGLLLFAAKKGEIPPRGLFSP